MTASANHGSIGPVSGRAVNKKRQAGFEFPWLKAQVLLASRFPLPYLPGMKLLLGILAYLLIAFVLGWGIILAVKGHPWLLVIGFIAYVVAFGKIGCLPKKSH
jgi:hypothetical protein